MYDAMTSPSQVSSANSPQAKEMADESMVRNLTAQAEAIWPQERLVFARHAPKADERILDCGCGTGELLLRLGSEFPGVHLTGVDLETAHLERARNRTQQAGIQAELHQGDVFHLPFKSDMFDLTVSRHVLQAIPNAPKAVAEMWRVTKPGGRMHMLAEDYGMLWCHPTALGSDGFWQVLPQKFAEAIGTDNQVGRKMFSTLTALGAADIHVDYVVVDTIRVPRDTFARIWEAWRDGYTDALAQHTSMPREEITRRWNEMIDCVRDPKGYALWQIPVWTARKP